MCLGKNVRTAVNGLAHAIENAPEHILGNGKLKGVTQKANLALLEVDAGGGFKKLNNSGIAVYLKHLAAACLAVGKLYFRQLVVGYALDLLDHHKRAGNLTNSFIFSDQY